MGSNPLNNTCCQPYNQANGGNVTGTCAAIPNTAQPPLISTTAATSSGVVTNSSPGTAYLACATPPLIGKTCNKQLIVMSSYSVGSSFANNNI